MKTLDSVTPQAVAPAPRLDAVGGRYATAMARREDSRSARGGAVNAGHWRDEGDRSRRRRPRDTTPVVQDTDAQDIDDEESDYDWDEVADIVCVGRGRIGVAVAVAAERAGLDFILAEGAGILVEGPGDDPDRDSTGLAALLGITDAETVEYLDALTEDVTPLAAADPTIPVRVVDGPLPNELPTKRIGTFFGAALQDWAGACVSSPYSVLYTRVLDATLSETYSSAQGLVEATVLDTIAIDPEHPADSLTDWLSTVAQEDAALPQPQGSLQRLVFDSGVVVGAILETAGGTRAVRARHGVMITVRDGLSPTGRTGDLQRCTPAHIALVSRPASRFGRLELLTREPR